MVFDRFYTSRKGTATVENASGLGLAISKQIIEAHGGSIVVSQSGLGGAKFVIYIKWSSGQALMELQLVIN